MAFAKELLFLQLSLLQIFLPSGSNEDSRNSGNYSVLQKSSSFRVIKSLSFYNHSWVQYLCSGWLEGFEVVRWDRSSRSFTLLYSWSKGNFLKNEEWTELTNNMRVFFFEFPLIFQSHDKKWQLNYPFEVQIASGCEWHFGEDSVSFVEIAYEGSDLVSLQNNSWIPSPKGGNRAQQVAKQLDKYKLSKKVMHRFYNGICPRLLLGLLDTGKTDLQQQVKPVAWLSSHRRPEPGRLLLVCHISGFYPKSVWAVWTRGDQEQLGTRREDLLPHADRTWYLRVTLDVSVREAAGLACRVRHSSLRGQDLFLHWEQRTSKGLMFLALMVPLVLLTMGLLFWFRKYWRCHGIPPISSFRLE